MAATDPWALPDGKLLLLAPFATSATLLIVDSSSKNPGGADTWLYTVLEPVREIAGGNAAQQVSHLTIDCASRSVTEAGTRHYDEAGRRTGDTPAARSRPVTVGSNQEYVLRYYCEGSTSPQMVSLNGHTTAEATLRAAMRKYAAEGAAPRSTTERANGPQGRLEQPPVPLPDGRFQMIAGSASAAVLLLPDRSRKDGDVADIWTYTVHEPALQIGPGLLVTQRLTHSKIDCGARTYTELFSGGYDDDDHEVVDLPASPPEPVSPNSTNDLVAKVVCGQIVLAPETLIVGRANALKLTKETIRARR